MKTQLSQDGRTVFHSFGPWGQIVKISNCLCEDGVARTIAVREPDTFFSTPGKTKAHGKTVTGFVTYDSDRERFIFLAYDYGKNASVIKSA